MRARWSGFALLGVVLCGAAGAQHHEQHDERALGEDPRLAPGQIAPVLQGLGTHHHKVTTSSERAQLFFDQGLKLTYGFNHQEALRAFKEAARLDPDCAMAYWGWALVLGPNLNLPMRKEAAPQAWEAIQLALARKGGVSAKERDYVDALARRYSADPDADRAPLDAAYAAAMRELRRKYPDDIDAATLYAASLMELSPWNYWTQDGRPRENTPEILATLESVIARDAHHEGALHYYIHAVESVDPERGSSAADALHGLAPGAGHLVHMPAHIWMQLGRYKESFEANVLASKSDEQYIVQCRAQGIYPLNYFPHNVHFVVWAAMLQGRSAAALEAARKVQAGVPHDLHGNDWALFETFLSMPVVTLVRFGRWDEVLAEPRPPEEQRLRSGLWHYGRAMALARTSKLEAAREELGRLDGIARDRGTAEVPVGYSNAAKVLTIAREIVAAEIAVAEKDFDRAIARLDHAVRLEDAMAYNEPPEWYHPVRHTLGAVLLEAGRPEEAEAVYWQDLRKRRDNGWALYGLWKSLEDQGRTAEAAEVEQRFRRAWADADVQLRGSRF